MHGSKMFRLCTNALCLSAAVSYAVNMRTVSRLGITVKSRLSYARTIVDKEKCILVGVERTKTLNRDDLLSFSESLKEMMELCDTAGLSVMGHCTQNRPQTHPRSYIGEGKLQELERLCIATGARTIVVDDDLSPRQQKALESLSVHTDTSGRPVKVLDRTAVILDIFAQHARSREGQLQVELAMLQYRSTRGPNVAESADEGQRGTGGAGLRGPGESKVELDRRKIASRIETLQKEIEHLKNQRQIQRQGRTRLGAPLVALVGYTNAGKSTVLNRLTKAGVLAENMLFATLDPTTRKVCLPNRSIDTTAEGNNMAKQGMEILLTDTVGFISKFPSHIVAAFRATLESLADADVLLHVIDRSNPAWEKHRAVVNAELARIRKESGKTVPVVEFWNKLDQLAPTAAAEVVESIRVAPIEMSVVAETKGSTHGDLVADVMSDGVEHTDEDPELSILSCLPDSVGGRQSGAPDTERGSRSVSSVPPPRHSVSTLSATSSMVRTGAELPVGIELSATEKINAVPVDHPTATLVAAGSAVALDGMSDLFDKLEQALTLHFTTVDCFIPYDKDTGVVASVLSRGVALDVRYEGEGVWLRCKVPAHIADTLAASGFVVG